MTIAQPPKSVPQSGQESATIVLTGVKPTGDLHLGNYVGAIRPMVQRSLGRDGRVLLMCVDWHGMSDRVHILEPGRMSRPMIAAFLALGFNAKDHSLILQSEFPEIQEVAWALGCVSGVGLLQRAHAYKDAVANGKEPTVGLFYYPVLMAADILTFDATEVPVGKDQVQHLEFASDMGKAFNHAVGSEVFREPRPVLQEQAILTGTDGRKMSKSYRNTIPLFGEKKAVEKLIKAIVTDSKGVNDVKEPESCAIFQIMRSFGRQEAVADMADGLAKGTGYGYGHAKLALIEEYEHQFGQHRQAYEHYLRADNEVRDLLAPGYEWAATKAAATRQRLRESLGLARLGRGGR